VDRKNTKCNILNRQFHVKAKAVHEYKNKKRDPTTSENMDFEYLTRIFAVSFVDFCFLLDYKTRIKSFRESNLIASSMMETMK